ncbi:MAG: hypothetical protein EPN53_02040 [Acidobacteria bacterium]|nr:MAG: hypothetical protein EPN53_02040 [Acidobacteriota bacterium]
MRSFGRRRLGAMAVAAALLTAASAPAQTKGWGTFSLFGQSSTQRQDTGYSYSTSDLIAYLTLRSPGNDDGGLEYGLDVRSARYSGVFDQNQVSIYDAYFGFRSKSGFGFRLGQMWLNDLGALGSFGGALLEYRAKRPSALGRLRLGLFGGGEPDLFKVSYAQGVRKAGGYVALDGDLGRRHVLGFVTVRNHNLTEREVVTLLNFLPIGRTFFLYQTSEYDIKGPGGTGKTGLNYFFANVRYAPSDVVEFQGTYHHGRSIDARTITNDELNGRPVDSRLLTGLLFESAGGRVTVSLSRHLRVWGGYYRDRNNLDAAATGRVQAGFWASDILGSGFDVTVSDNRIDRTGNRYDSWYTSVGASIGRSVYITADYTTSLSVLSFTGSDGVIVESRPQSKRYSLSANVNLTRHLSLLLQAERLLDDTSHEDRVMAGATVRF